MTTPVGHGCPNIFFAPPVPSAAPQLSVEEQEYVEQLISLPLDSIIDRRSGEKKCKELGQEIFDKAKAASNGDSFAAKAVLKKIHNAICPNQSDDQRDAHLRKQYVDIAWAGVGDTIRHWGS